MKLTNSDIIDLAKETGFDLIGFAEALQLTGESDRLDQWLRSGYQAGMGYMERNRDKRLNVKNILPSARSVISLGVNYFVPEDYSEPPGTGKISRYAWSKDYHLVVGGMLDELIEGIKRLDPDFIGIPYVDTGPVLDKAWGARAGIGWQGKHTNLISRDIGSWFFIANIITNTAFEYPLPAEDFCGSCSACIDACPTGAIVEEYVVDSAKCISYLTIENKGEIDSSFAGYFEGWLFGCDICQEVCPWNIKFGTETGRDEFLNIENKELSLEGILEMNGSEFKKKFSQSPVVRAKLNGLRRNALFLLSERKI